MNIRDWIKDKGHKMKVSVEDAGKKAGEWAKKNPEQTVTLGITFFGAVVGIINGCRRDAKKREEKERREREFYDHSLGTRWYLRRTPTQNEKLEIERRRSKGEGYGSIFSSMNLL